MKKKQKTKHIAAAVITTALSVGVGVAGVPAMAVAGSHSSMEKCYGIAKKGKNDCGTKYHSCAGQAKKNNAGDEWIYVKKGNCLRIVGGSLTPKDDSKKG